jgi:nitroimidazol reductase NimA-like FMN-containing flavoprotein (pyridoxamine 5'-phosphate oxidase superfamily)
MTSDLSHSPRPFGAKVIEEMSPEDCVTFLAKTTTVGRVAFLSSTGQQLLPVNFVFHQGNLYLATAGESILAELARGCSDVVFEIDYADRMTQHGWSVIVRGETGAAQVEFTEDSSLRLPRPWAPGTRDVLVQLTPHQITGRRIQNDLPPRR